MVHVNGARACGAHGLAWVAGGHVPACVRACVHTDLNSGSSSESTCAAAGSGLAVEVLGSFDLFIESCV